MAGMKIIITRPSPHAETFAAEVRRFGAEPVLSPVMAIRHRRVDIDLDGIVALAFTSANGVRAFAANSPRRDIAVFAVGAATAAAARMEGFDCVRSAGGDVESLAELISLSKPTRIVLHLAGSERAGDLIATLARKAVAARRAVIYDAVATDDLSAEAKAALAADGANSAVVFFSPRSARLFLAQAATAGLSARLAEAAAFCLSAEVAIAAGAGRWAAIDIAATRDVDGVLALVGARSGGRKSRKDAGR